MSIFLNGKPLETQSTTVAELLQELQLTQKRLAVEVNGVVVPKSGHQACLLKPDDRVEILTAVGGG